LADLWGVLIGGALAIAGGLISHRMQANEREHRSRRDKLQELTTSALASQTWLEDIRDSKLFGKEVRAGGSPLWNAHAIATINFPELVQPVAKAQ
jgi:hypothetical protein